MKVRLRKIWISLITIFMVILFPYQVWAAQSLSSVQAESYFLMDAESGVILAEKDAETPRPPASMTKMMTHFIILDEIKKGTIKWDDVVKVSARAAAINEGGIFLEPNEALTVKDLFISSVVKSANDATIALSEHIAGSEAKFVERMNEKAKELGMKSTHFRNTTGLNMEDYGIHAPEVPGEHVMGAQDSAILGDALLRSHPDILTYTSIANHIVHKDKKDLTINSSNLMLPARNKLPYDGVDGLKTGHTQLAGYCFTSTAKKGDLRVISVVMKTKSDSERFVETKKLLDYAFEQYEEKTLVKKGATVPGDENMALPNGVEKSVEVQSKSDITLPVKKGASEKDYEYKVTFAPGVKAPILAGTEVGKVEVLHQGKSIPGFKPVPLVASKNVEEGSWVRLFFRSIGDEISSWF
ncbi:D-alanyl-D-alanine carboxypeptidase (penicillin-binding protein 5/6) [Thermoactinomyces sp. DSM 45891]|uniref:D-alanyl-D-alanine carboxypeptidase family protein n=1 Tax=Thermoactinomyces sp. DSM 45891 TaxID=1761907 RepID=UPI0009137588|nr:D-alanyl-D-alanine carboxypeptidase family protein [Thermoactinomyces sp. DSM 45891]SFX31302.1 D-alanyl-D-alanine carboxypeptidase (penicillin-binding protein 5/6) [Thermoactinomyces sp. DSM 45891]